MWCKTVKRFSDQVKKAKKKFKKQFSTALPYGAIAAGPLVKETCTKLVKTGVQVVTKKTAIQALIKVVKEAMKTGARMASKEMATQTVSTVGQEAVKTGVKVASRRKETQSISSAGQVVKTGIRTVTKVVIEETVSTAGKDWS